MTIIEFLDNEIFSTSKIVETDGLAKHLEKTFGKYKNILSLISDENLSIKINDQKENISGFCENIISSLAYYQKGYIELAYSDFKKAMEILKPFLFPENKGKVADIIGLHNPFYRARIGTNKTYSKGQMFHLPFSKREFASTQRFSIPGLPCLYLSSSIYVCWEELNRPFINTLQVSRFQKENLNLNILDMSLTAAQLKLKYKLNIDNEIQRNHFYDYMTCLFLIRWPLSLVCSLMVTNENAPFKHEYIFPQFLLQWVTAEKGVDGIKYFSVKSNSYDEEDYSQFINYVFPPKKMDYGNYCSHLKESFKLSDSVSFEIFKLADPNLIFINQEWLEKAKYKVKIDPIKLELIKGYPMPYTHTLFGKMELLMRNLEVDFLSENEMFNNTN